MSSKNIYNKVGMIRDVYKLIDSNVHHRVKCQVVNNVWMKTRNQTWNQVLQQVCSQLLK
jgi:hypothetical protein